MIYELPRQASIDQPVLVTCIQPHRKERNCWQKQTERIKHHSRACLTRNPHVTAQYRRRKREKRNGHEKCEVQQIEGMIGMSVKAENVVMVRPVDPDNQEAEEISKVGWLQRDQSASKWRR